MEYEKYHFIINPTSGGGSAGKIWGQTRNYVESQLGKFSFEFTASKGHGIELAKRASEKGIERLVAIGGDGSISEIITGVMQSGNRDIGISILNLGTGGDFCRTLGVSGDLKIALKQLTSGKTIHADIGILNYTDNDGNNSIRNFINIAGCGMAGEVVKSINQSKKRFGSFSYYISSVKQLLSYKNKAVKIFLDNAPPISHRIVTIAIANGKYFGGGMQIAPEAKNDDGIFHITVIEDWNLFKKIFLSANLYNGKILKTSGVFSYTAKKVRIEADKDMAALIDCDGEDIGSLPMEARVVPSAVKFIV